MVLFDVETKVLLTRRSKSPFSIVSVILLYLYTIVRAHFIDVVHLAIMNSLSSVWFGFVCDHACSKPGMDLGS